MPVPILTVAQMREWEAATWKSGVTEEEVICLVGERVARHAVWLTEPDGRILVLAGKGHNGDDARQAMAHFDGRSSRLLNVIDPERDLGTLKEALAERPDLVVDGLFGIGLNRPLSDPWITLIESINASDARVLAVDVPSGLNAELGRPEGASTHAAVTLTVGAPKVGLLKREALPFVGRLEVAAGVGLVPCPVQSEMEWVLPEDFDRFPPLRAFDSHKGTFGHLLIIAGSLGYHGAAVLASQGALRAHPGLVTLICPEDVYLPVAAQSRAAMVHPWRRDHVLPDTCTALLVGPGLAAPNIPEDLRTQIRSYWQELPLPMIVDASALHWIPAGPVRADALRVITPHPGEAARMLQISNQEVQADRAGALRKLSAQWGNCWVVLKGHQTLIGRANGSIAINSSGNALLAQGGSGDTLAGFLAGLLAQPMLQSDPVRTIRYVVWEHGATADLLSRSKPNWMVEELAESLGLARGAAYAHGLHSNRAR